MFSKLTRNFGHGVKGLWVAFEFLLFLLKMAYVLNDKIAIFFEYEVGIKVLFSCNALRIRCLLLYKLGFIQKASCRSV